MTGRRRTPGRSTRRRRKRDAAFREKKTAEFPGQDAPIGTCPDCGKRAYETRPQAERTARRVYPNQTMRVYQCGRWWHLTSQNAETVQWYRATATAQEDT